MLNIDCRVIDTAECEGLKVTSIMREICGPYDDAIYEKYEEYYGSTFTLEELIASCSVSGGIAFFQKHGKMSELVSIIVEEVE